MNVKGCSKDYNRYLEQHDLKAPRVSEQVALAACILSVVGTVISWMGMVAGATMLGMVFGIPTAMLTLIFVYQACTSLNVLPANVIEEATAARASVGEAAPTQGLGISSLVLGILSILIA